MGGAEYRCKLIIDELCRRNTYDLFYLCRNTAPGFVANGYKVQKIGTRIGKFGLYFDSVNLYLALKRIAPHIIYQNGGSAHTGIAALYAKNSGAKLIHQICNEHGLNFHQRLKFRTHVKYAIERIFFNFGIKHTDVIIGQSKHQDNLFQNRYGRNCDIIIPLGHPLPKNEIQKSKKIVVLWIGNLRSVKQPEIFVKLAKKFHNRKNISFVMMGGSIGPMNQFKDHMQKIESTPNLTYLGEVAQDEVNRWLREGHVLVNTSVSEGFSNTFVQAWLREVPLVSLNVDPDEIITREKIGFHSKTFEKLVYDVTTLTENKSLMEEMGTKARIYAEKNHTSDKMVEKLVKLFQPN
jgi:glycosyltransferase involved in cell wall biosynthesis